MTADVERGRLWRKLLDAAGQLDTDRLRFVTCVAVVSGLTLEQCNKLLHQQTRHPKLAVRRRPRSPLGEYVLRERKARGWSQAELSRRSQLSLTEISRLETGVSRGSSVRLLGHVAAVFGLSTDALTQQLQSLRRESEARS